MSFASYPKSSSNPLHFGSTRMPSGTGIGFVATLSSSIVEVEGLLEGPAKPWVLEAILIVVLVSTSVAMLKAPASAKSPLSCCTQTMPILWSCSQSLFEQNLPQLLSPCRLLLIKFSSKCSPLIDLRICINAHLTLGKAITSTSPSPCLIVLTSGSHSILPPPISTSLYAIMLHMQ